MSAKVIIFDYFGVVAPETAAISGLEFCHRHGLDPEKLPIIWQQFRDTLDLGESTQTDFVEATRSYFGLQDPLTQLASEFAELDKDNSRVHPEMAKLIQELKKKYRVALMSNVSRELANTVRSEGGYGLFEKVFLSYEAGKTKADQSWFVDVTKSVDTDADKIILIDDNIENVKRAEMAGWVGSIHFSTIEALESDLRGRGILF